MYYDYDYGYGSSSSGLEIGDMFESAGGVWMIIALVLAIVGGILIYFLFLNKKNDGKFKGFLGWLYEFLSFKKLTIEVILKVLYLIMACYITLASFALIGTNFLSFLLMLILGNVIVRICYEFSLILILIYRNVVEMNKKLGKDKKDDN